MSRSYKKNVVWTQGQSRSKNRKWWKREANKKVRKYKSIPNGKSYKRIYDSWNICDWKFGSWTNSDIRWLIERGRYKKYQLYMK